MRFRSTSAVAALVVLGALLLAVTSAGAAGDNATQRYLVTLLEEPAVAYEGGTAGIPATKPGKGKKLDKGAPDVERYVGHLKRQHDAVLDGLGAGEQVVDYVYAVNGFAAELTEAQAEALAKKSDVVSVEPDRLYSVDTSSTPDFLGLSGDNGIWSQLRGPQGFGSKGGAGENIIIGVIDSGVWPENVSYTDKKIADGRVKTDQLAYGPPPAHWQGTCQAGEQFTANLCNNKLIGARFYNVGWGGSETLKAARPWEFMSPRDYHGHGDHTMSTAGGNYGVPATGAAASFGTISGVAPRARVAQYKALWSTQDSSTASGWGVDFVAAADQAVADGVDVINFSVGGTTSNFLDITQTAFRNAAAAGVYVSTSAGNTGPGANTVAHPSPWLSTAAAMTHDRVGQGSVTIGAAKLDGASAGTGSASGNLITFGAAGSPQRLCQLGTLPAGAASGKIVFCERGVNARVEKSFEAQRVGAIGMVLVNPVAGQSLNADLHFVPSVHLTADHYAAVQTAALAGQSASVVGQVLYDQPAPFMAAFSSRGPITAGAGDVLKPDFGAPGVDVLAAVAPPGNRGRDYDLYSGTSMSAPHIAGLAALFMQMHPTWSPMAIKSALMTSAYDVLDAFTGTAASDASALRAFAQGAGHVDPPKAIDPGLVYDSDVRDWEAFLCGATTGMSTATCNARAAEGYSFDRSDMNLASIAIGDLAGTQTVKRRVTNVSKKASTYTASVSISGIEAVVTPSTLTIGPGETKSFEIAFKRTTADLNRYTAGHLTWTDGTHVVRSPIVIKPVSMAAPPEVTSNGSPVSWQVKTGYNGPLTAAVGGLTAGTQTAFTVAQDPNATFAVADPTGTYKKDVVVPSGSVFRAGVYEDAIAPTGTDLDLYVYFGATNVGQSSDDDSNEQVTITNDTAAPVTLSVYVHGFDTNGPQATGTLYTWALAANTPAGNTTISGVGPATVGTQTHTATFNGLAANTRYFGRVDYGNGTSTVATTLLTVTTP